MKRRYKGKAFAAAFLAMTGLLAGTMTSFGVVYMSEAPYDWEENADTESYESPGYVDSGTGPGAAVGSAEEQEIAAGPTVAQVTLTEQYYDDYKIYEESINNQFFFYTNVANGGITDQSVLLDMPQNIFCTVEKDGAEYDYVPGQAFSDYGTYVVRVTAVEDTTVPFSEQKEYRALFRFRIQVKPPEEAEEGTGLKGFGGSGPSSLWQESGIWPDGSAAGAGQSLLLPGESQTESQESEPVPGESLTEETSVSEEESSEASQENGDGSGESDSESEPAQEAAAEEEVLPGSYSRRTQVYDRSRGRYEVTFANGRTLSSNVPEGYVGPATVELLVSEGEGSIYRNDEPLEYIENMSLKEPGYYRLDIDGQMWSFAIMSAVGETDYYLAPEGMEFTSVYYEGEPGELPGGKYLPMKEDGQYQITMAGKEKETLEVVLKKDTQKPEFVVNVKGGTAQIQYISDDIDEVILEKNGAMVEGFSGYTINSPGSYRLTAKDGAGNAASADFTLKYQVNTYGIVAVVLVILLIIGGVVFVIHVKKTVRVR